MIDGVTSFHLWTSRSKTNKGPDQSMSNNNFVARGSHQELRITSYGRAYLGCYEEPSVSEGQHKTKLHRTILSVVHIEKKMSWLKTFIFYVFIKKRVWAYRSKKKFYNSEFIFSNLLVFEFIDFDMILYETFF